jgi:O-antigen/teichoic acid export membrane protein
VNASQPPASPLRRLTGDALVYGIGGSANRLVGVLFVPVFTRIFSPSDYGVLDLLTTLMSLLTLFAMLGANSAVFYYYHRASDHAERGRLVSTAIVMATGLALLIALLGILFANRLGPVLVGGAHYQLAVSLTFLLLPANVAASMVLDLLRLEFRRFAFIGLGLGRTLFSSALGVALVIWTPMGIAGLIGAQAVLATLSAVVGLWLTRRLWPSPVDLRVAGQVLRFGLPLIPTGLSYWVLQYVDRYFVLGYRGTTELGIYAIANRLAGMMLVLTLAFQTAWWPFAYAHAGQPGDRELFARVFKLASAGLLAAVLLLGLFAREALIVVTTPAFVPAYAYVGLLALALVVHSSYQVVSLGVQLAARTSSMAWTSAIAAVLNLALNLLLIPRFGLWGAAVATVAAYLASTCLLYVVAQRHYPIPYRPRQAILVGFAVVLLGSAGLLLDQLAPTVAVSLPVTTAKVGLAALGLLLLAAYLRLSIGRLRAAVASLLGARTENSS